jgi:hypothetical protein
LPISVKVAAAISSTTNLIKPRQLDYKPLISMHAFIIVVGAFELSPKKEPGENNSSKNY